MVQKKEKDMPTPSEVSIRLKRSTIGHPDKMRVMLLGLGLKRIGQTVRRPQTPQVLGLIHKVQHLIEVSHL